jgi:hypothetical protein
MFCHDCGGALEPFEPPQPTKHPDYDHWVKTWGQMHADDENRAWLSRQRLLRNRDLTPRRDLSSLQPCFC